MCTGSEFSIKFFAGWKRFSIIILMASLLCSHPLTMIGQNTSVIVNVSVMPPYTSSISAYIDTPNKILVTLTNTSSDFRDLNVYLRASITSQGGIKVTTEPGFKPATPIVISHGRTYRLNSENIADAFDVKHVLLEGININQLISGAGLPEDFYQICVQAFDYSTDQPLSGDQPIGCSNLFQITNLEPPTIISPICGEPIIPNGIQLIQANWSIPPGALSGCVYHFEMVEIPENSTIDPKEAFETSAFPVFYEEQTSRNTLLLTIQKVVLTQGYRYAFRVRVEDISGKLHFRNNGISEVCSFTYGSKAPQYDLGDKEIKFISPKDNNKDSVLTSIPPNGFYTSWRVNATAILDTRKGRMDQMRLKLNPALKEDNNLLFDFPGCLYRVEFFDKEASSKPIYTITTDQPFFQADAPSADRSVLNNPHEKLKGDRKSLKAQPFEIGKSYWIQVSLESQSTFDRILTSEKYGFKYMVPDPKSTTLEKHTIKGVLAYQFGKLETATYPISSADLSLKCKYFFTSTGSGKQYELSENEVMNIPGSHDSKFDLKSKSFLDLSPSVVAKTVTDEKGNFNFNYSWPDNEPLGEVSSSFSYHSPRDGTLTGRVERVMKIEFTNPYFESPQRVVNINQPSVDVGEIITNVHSYELKATLEKGFKLNRNVTESLAGKVIYLFRKQKLPGLPQFEGERLKSHQPEIPNHELKSAGYYYVASGKTIGSASGNGGEAATVIFPHLIENLFNGDEYYWYVEGFGLPSAQPISFTQVKKVMVPFMGLDGSSKVSDVKITSINPYNFVVDARFTVISAEPPMSGIKGKLVYEFPGKPGNARPLANRKISIISCLVTNEPGKVSKIVKNSNFEDYESAYPWDKVVFNWQTDAAGNFSFEFPNIENEKRDLTNGPFMVTTGKLNRTETWNAWEGNPERNFRINYETKQVKVKRVFRIVVNDPTGLFMSPDDNIEIEPLKTADVGTLISNVLTYRLTGDVMYNKTHKNGNDQNGKAFIDTYDLIPIQKADCYVLREKSLIDNYQLPTDEGQNIVGNLQEMPSFKIIGTSTTDSKGSFVFDNLLFRNSLVPITLYFKTRDMDGDANFEPRTVSQNVFNPFLKPVFLFNADYEYATITGFSTDLLPLTPTIKGKVTSNVNAGRGIKGADVTVYFYFNNAFVAPSYNCKTDTAGYFDLGPGFDKITKSGAISNLKNVEVYISKKDFHYVENGVSKTCYRIPLDKVNFEKGKQTILNVPLTADGEIRGTIVNEKGAPIDSYVQFLENRTDEEIGGEGTMDKTAELSGNFGLVLKGYFSIPALPGANRKLAIIPKDVTYFPDTILIVNVKASGVTDLGNIKVYERSHRITFSVREILKSSFGNANVAVKFAKVSLIGSPTPVEAIADEKGKVTMRFNNVSETNLSLRISGPTGSNYVPKEMSFTNYESDLEVKLPTVFLEQGLSLKGKILLDGKPTSEAEVYVELNSGSQTGLEYNTSSQGTGSITESQYLFKAYPKSDGTFEISTIPPELNGKQVYIKAVYKKGNQNADKKLSAEAHDKPVADGAPTVIGDSKLIGVPDGSGNLVLNLKTYDKMRISDVWGFPLEITKIQPPQSDGKVYVSGRVKLDGYSSGFDPLEPLTLEIENILFKPGQLVHGIPLGEPDQNSVDISIKRELKMKYAKAFNVKLKALAGSTFSIVRNADGTKQGSLNATVSIVDNSFQFPSSYLNFNNTSFNFCNTQGMGSNIFMNPAIKVFNSSTTGNGNNVVKYNLCNLGADGKAQNLIFKFIDFEAHAFSASSTIEGPEISLDASLHAKVKNAGDVEVKIGKLVLKNNAVAAISGNTPLVIELKDGGGIYDADKTWKFEAKNWRIDPKVGGIMSEDCMLHTGAIDIPYSYFNLRNDFAYLGNPDKSNISVGGYHIDFASGASVSTGYNPSCGSDRKGHWQLIIYPSASGNTPAFVNNLPNMNGAPLELETVSLLSNHEDVFSIGTGAKKMKLYNTVDFKPQTVFSLAGGLVLNGVSDFRIPRVRNGIGTRLTFVKTASPTKNPTWDAIDLNFDGRGNIKFLTNTESTSQVFNASQHTFSTFGTIQESGILAPVAVKLTYTDPGNDDKSKIRTTIAEAGVNQTIKIGETTTKLEKITCKTKADQNDWDLFVFEGDLAGLKGVSTSSTKHMVFTVYGEIKSQMDGFKADGIDNTSFGGMQFTYQSGRLIGTMTMNNVPLGSSIVNGVANILMDSNGWAFYSNCRASNVPAPDPCSVYMGILIGNYSKILTPDMKTTVLAYALKKELPSTFNTGLQGFYMVGGRELPFAGLDIGINVVVASAYVSIPVAAVDAAFYMNFVNGKKSFGLGLSGEIIVAFGLGSITCTDLSGQGHAIANVLAASDNGSFNLTGSANFSASLHVSQGVPYLFGCIDAIDIPIALAGGFTFSAKPFKVSLYISK